MLSDLNGRGIVISVNFSNNLLRSSLVFPLNLSDTILLNEFLRLFSDTADKYLSRGITSGTFMSSFSNFSFMTTLPEESKRISLFI